MLIDAEKTELIKNRKNTIYKEKWMEVNTDEIAKKCMDAINEKLKNLKKLNIIVQILLERYAYSEISGTSILI